MDRREQHDAAGDCGAAAAHAAGADDDGASVSESEQGERDKAARAALGPAAAYAKGDQLRVACERGDAAAALQLIGEGADPDCVDGRGNSPLILCTYERLGPVAARLIAAGANLDLVDEKGNSALIMACFDKRAATALLLVEAGAATTQLDSEGKSALDWADEKGLAAVSAAIRARERRAAAEMKAGRSRALDRHR